MKKVLVLEDQEKTREALVQTVENVDNRAIIFDVATVEEAYAIAMSNTIDVFILDIILKTGGRDRDNSGADFAQNMRMVSRYRFTPIIFLTSLYDSKLNMYSSVHCFKFIEKPCDYGAVEDVVREALHYHTRNGKDRQYFYRSNGVLEAIRIEDIVYIKSVGQSLEVTTIREKCTIPYKTLKVMKKELDTEDFIQCSRNTIVNKDYVKTVDLTNRFIYLENCDDILEIGSVLKRNFMHGLQADWEDKIL